MAKFKEQTDAEFLSAIKDELTPTPNSEAAAAFVAMNPIAQGREIKRRKGELGQRLVDIADELICGDVDNIRCRYYLLRLTPIEQAQIEAGILILTIRQAIKILFDREERLPK